LGSSELYVTHREEIERSIAAVCRRHRLGADDADEFASVARLHLLEDDCFVLRRFSGRSTLRTYLVVVVTRQFQDWRNARWGKWRPSAEARRLGEIAVAAETLTVRDGLTLDQAHEVLRTNLGLTIARQDLEAMAARFPVRAGRRSVPDDALVDRPAATAAADELLHARRAQVAAEASQNALASALAALPDLDRLVLRMRFEDDCTVAEIARLLRVDQKPLYRRIDRLLANLRSTLERQGLTRDRAAELIAHHGFDQWPEAAGGNPSAGVRLFSESGRLPAQPTRTE
jgi:RNA polymerase sigma factor for flagellar operon FliA